MKVTAAFVATAILAAPLAQTAPIPTAEELAQSLQQRNIEVSAIAVPEIFVLHKRMNGLKVVEELSKVNPNEVVHDLGTSSVPSLLPPQSSGTAVLNDPLRTTGQPSNPYVQFGETSSFPFQAETPGTYGHGYRSDSSVSSPEYAGATVNAADKGSLASALSKAKRKGKKYAKIASKIRKELNAPTVPSGTTSTHHAADGSVHEADYYASPPRTKTQKAINIAAAFHNTKAGRKVKGWIRPFFDHD